jgi:acyl-CoA synthetase (AMP-forming)/AMP-acid ligase II
LALASPDTGGSRGCRIESASVKMPAPRLATKDLMSHARHRTRIQLERLTAIHERRVVGPRENFFTLATGEFVFTTQIPRTAAGKFRKTTLRDEYGGILTEQPRPSGP